MDSPSLPSRVLIAYDATKDLGNDEIQVTIKEVRMRGDILRRGDTLVVFGVLHKVQHPTISHRMRNLSSMKTKEPLTLLASEGILSSGTLPFFQNEEVNLNRSVRFEPSGSTGSPIRSLVQAVHDRFNRPPVGYHTLALAPVSSNRAMVEEVSKKLHMYVNKLLPSAQECEDEGVDIEVKVTAGTPIKQVILQEIVAYKTTWVIFDRWVSFASFS
ncbi:hypothetical protein CK203_019985 [Vitis vinifera]|uniref:Uncharacterized protein n=1 Tax=Vitis vinifera TaxID=29760 RepID=A0A438J373_VITVI|nr:hypothetical protein CK203_019985 [Vitis vinifera]